MTMKEMNDRVLAEIAAVIEGIGAGEVEDLVQALCGAKRIACFGVGREGLMMKALCMRLYHIGLDAHVAGDMTAPPLGRGDLLLVSAGPGYFSTVQALIDTAKAAGATTGCFTAEPAGRCPAAADHRVVLPAQTMARDTQGPASLLPMGSLYEGVQYLVFEYLVLMLRDRLDVAPAAMRARHTNLE